WVPDEAAGPGDYIVVVRVSEPGSLPSATTSFLLGVREVNTPPTLEPIAGMTVNPGDLILLTNRATDADLPAQSLTFFGTGLPAGATLDPITGVLRWLVPEDPQAGTNRATITVVDNASPARSAEQSFDIIVQAPPRVVINEIMHRPTQMFSEYVELANISMVNSVDISGWRLEGYNLTFPANTILAPNSFVCVARTLTGFRGTYGGAPSAYGDALVTLPANGGLLRLIKPATSTAGEQVIDEVEFSLRAPWPANATTGPSLQLIDPWEDNRRVSNWSAASQAVTNATTTLVPIGGAWRYWQNASSPGAWNAPGYSDAVWTLGSALFYVEDAALPATKATPLTLGATTYYFRTRFNFSGSTEGATLTLRPVIDDGAVFYLNGQEVFRLGMPAGIPTQTTFANRTTGEATFEGPFEVPATGLTQGDNVIAVEVHQANAGSSDIVFGSEIQLTTTSPVSFTPGAANSVRRDLPTIPPIWINEVHPINTTGITDSAGERDPWIELYNDSSADVNLGGWSLTDDFAALTKYDFPLNALIPAHGFLLVWADGSISNPSGELHANFRLSSTGGTVVLSTRQSGVPVIADYLQYSSVADQSYGAERDGHPLARKLLSQSTPGTANGGAINPPTITLDRPVGGGVRLSWSTVQGQSYIVEATTNLVSPQWQTVMQGNGNGGSLSYTDSTPLNHTTRFFRLRMN
ncbi:MAG: lamin tail domain-containing protein, partial [Limisphaerales bacterium]